MLIGFIGGPAVGKSTIAAKMFSNFKEMGINCELIVEIARQFIAEKRLKENIGPKERLFLNDLEQIDICKKQNNIEKIMTNSSDISTIVISDSSSLNAGLYMSDRVYNEVFLVSLFQELINGYDLLFFVHEIERKSLPYDPNRIHSLDEIHKLKNRSFNLLNRLKESRIQIHELIGTLNLENRYSEACTVTLNKQCEIVQRM